MKEFILSRAICGRVCKLHEKRYSNSILRWNAVQHALWLTGGIAAWGVSLSSYREAVPLECQQPVRFCCSISIVGCQPVLWTDSRSVMHHERSTSVLATCCSRPRPWVWLSWRVTVFVRVLLVPRLVSKVNDVLQSLLWLNQ